MPRLTVSETLKRTAEGAWEFQVEPSARETRVVVSYPVISGGVCTINVMTESQVSGFTPVENRELKRIQDLAAMSDKRWIPFTERRPLIGQIFLAYGINLAGETIVQVECWTPDMTHWQPIELPKDAP